MPTHRLFCVEKRRKKRSEMREAMRKRSERCAPRVEKRKAKSESTKLSFTARQTTRPMPSSSRGRNDRVGNLQLHRTKADSLLALRALWNDRRVMATRGETREKRDARDDTKKEQNAALRELRNERRKKEARCKSV
ncbi:hypothetical protein VII00023_08804 [Vibrio ichthyoenteri ATCC 700023]|uniref:Uncharacterized protein n=1 Tax=Vibrio ichthyoenteri ATCC 700023 TaxID=870968 RepID=F9S021_9VIBR|nr:hypothetical protein VII00023_08804 [Vibrio ichthyoenteri ATCC 700023]